MLLGIILAIHAHRGQIFAAGLLEMLGIFLQAVGLVAVTYTPHYTLEMSFFSSGVNLIVVVLGLFALSQAFLLPPPDESSRSQTRLRQSRRAARAACASHLAFN